MIDGATQGFATGCGGFRHVPIMRQVGSGYSHFGVTNADQLLLAVSQGAPLVALFAPIQTSPRCLMVHEDSGIEDFSQLSNQRVAMRSGAVWAEFLKKNVPFDNTEFLPPGNIALFLDNKDMAQQAYVFSEPFLAQKKGVKVRTLMVSDLGFNPYTSVLFCDQWLIEAEPDLVRQMVQACHAGWKDYVESPESVNKYINQKNPEMDLETLAFGAAALKPLCADSDGQLSGTMTKERWQELVDQMVELEMIDADQINLDQLIRTDFLTGDAKSPTESKDP